MKREIRSGLISGMAGVGSVIDVGQESFVVPGINQWSSSQLRPLDLKRLSTRLRKKLKTPREHEPSLKVRRFPRAMFCEKCRGMITWLTEFEKEGEEPSCRKNGCDGKLVPMRFVTACENGHLGDVDWRYWAHSDTGGNRNCRAKDRLSFKIDSHSKNAGLGSLRVECGTCGSSRSLEDLSNKSLIKEIFRTCGGRHPWIYGHTDPCDADVVVLQRGATNLHYPRNMSALDIPSDLVESEAAQFSETIRSHKSYPKLINTLKNTTGDAKDLVEAYTELIAGSIGCEAKTVLDVATADIDGRTVVVSGEPQHGEPLDQQTILDEEWKTIEGALKNKLITSANFFAAQEDLAPHAPAWMKSLISGVLLVSRLREVRAYLGFQRVKPSTEDKTVPPDIGADEGWLPASEVFGEGIVLRLNFGILERWIAQIPSAERQSLDSLEEKRVSENFWFLPTVDPAFIALHTLSHLLLRRITFECGYSSSSLRERLYFSRDAGYAGMMIYTADGDSEGSLGGLVRQGRQDRLAQSLRESLDQGHWCSSDPVCSETAGQGLGGFNHAACHACCLVSETSCTTTNTLLDRRMLYDPSWGLLAFLERAG
jgi:hypothetical protein